MKKTIPVVMLFFVTPAFALDPALIECRQIEDLAARVSCYDRLVDSQSAPASSATRATNVPQPPKNAVVAPDAQSLFGTNDAEAKRIVASTLAIEEITQIEAMVTDVRRSASRKLTLVLDNGQVWRQLDNQRLRLKDGDAIVVREASLGSFLLEKQSGSRKIRVKRLK